MNFQLADDARSKEQRASSPDGYITSDVDLLLNLKILQKGRDGIQINKKLVTESAEIRDFLTWTTGQRKVPLPPLARRILCLKRALIKNSIASVTPSLMQRTGEKQQLEEIDSLLRADGVKNLDDPKACMTEGSRWISKSLGGVNKVTSSGPGCSTTVNCGADSEISKLIAEIKTKLDTMSGTSPAATAVVAPASNKIDQIAADVAKLVAVVAPATGQNIAQKLDVLEGKINALRPGGPSPAQVVEDDTASIRSNASNLSVITTKLNELTTKLDGFSTLPADIAARAARNLIIARAGIPDPVLPKVDEILGLIKKKPITPALPIVGPTQPGPPTIVPGSAQDVMTAIEEVKGLVMSLNPSQEVIAKIHALEDLMRHIDGALEEAFGIVDGRQNQLVRNIGAISESLHASDQDGRAEVDRLYTTIQQEFQALKNALREGDDEGKQAVQQMSGMIDAITEETFGVGDQLSEVLRILDDAMGYIRDVPTQLLDVAVKTVGNLMPRLKSIEDALTRQLESIKEDTEAIRSNVSDLKVGSESRNTALSQKLDQQDAKLDALAESLEDLKRGLGTDRGHVFDALDENRERLEYLQGLVEAFRCPDLNTEPVMNALTQLRNNVSQQIRSVRARNQAGANTARIAALENTIRTLEQQVRDCTGRNARIAELEEEATTLRAQVANLQRNTNTAHGTIRNLTAAAEQRNREIAEKNRRIDEIEEERARITVNGEQELHEARLLVERLKEGQQVLRDTLAKNEKRMREYQNALNSKTNSSLTLEQEKANLQARLNAAESNSEAKNATIQASREEAERLQRRIEEIEEESRTNIQTLTEEKNELEREKGELQGRIRQLNSNLAQRNVSIQTLQDEKTALEGQLADVEERTSAVIRELEEEQSRMESEIATLRSTSASDRAELTTLRSSIGELERQIRERTNNNNSKNATINRLTEEKTTLQGKLNECEAARTEIQAAIDRLEAERAEEKATNTAEIERLTNELSSLTNRHAEQMRQASEDFQRQLEEESSKCTESIQEAMDQLVEEQDNHRKSVGSRDKTIKDLNAEIARLKQATAAAASNTNTKSRESADLQRRLDQALAEKRTLEQQLADCLKSKKALEEQQAREIAEVQKERDDCEESKERNVGAAQQERNAAKRNVAVAQQERNAMRDQYNVAEKFVTQLGQEKDDIAEERDGLAQDLGFANEAITELQRASQEALRRAEDCESAKPAAPTPAAPAAPAPPSMPDLSTKDALPHLVVQFNQVAKYTNKGRIEPALDVNRTFIDLIAGYRSQNPSQFFMNTLHSLYQTATGKEIMRRAHTKGLPPLQQFERIVLFLNNLPEDIKQYSQPHSAYTTRYGRTRKGRRNGKKNGRNTRRA